MARRRKPEEHTNHERWLISYADFITLLFAFFVVMFASSYSDDKKIGKVSQAVQSAFKELAVFEPSSKNVPLFTGGGLPDSDRDTGSAMAVLTEKELVELVARNSDIQKIKAQLEAALKEEVENHTVRISQDSRGVAVSLAEAGFFDSGSSEVKEAGFPVLQRIAEKLSQIPQNLRVEGHTDNTPIHTAQFPSNWELSTARATNVLKYLSGAHIPPERLSAAGYGEYRPAALNSTPEGRSVNRRVDVIIIGSSAQLLEPAH